MVKYYQYRKMPLQPAPSPAGGFFCARTYSIGLLRRTFAPCFGAFLFQDTKMDWRDFPNFTAEEFRCKATGKLRMDQGFMEKLQALRTEYGKPLIISSGYRDPAHPIEAAKEKPGAHSTGHACDITIRGGDAVALIALAVKHGFTGIGVSQKGASRFIHLDDLPHDQRRPRPWLWSY